MKNFKSSKSTFLLLFVGIISSHFTFAQNSDAISDRVHFGGSLGLNIGSGFTNIVVAPSVIYDVNDYFSAGVGLQGSYVNWKNNFESSLSMGKYPNSSIIRSLYLLKCLSLASNLFSRFARFSCCNKSLHLMK